MFYVRDEYWEQRVLCSDLDMLLCEVIQRIRDVFGVETIYMFVCVYYFSADELPDLMSL